MFVPHPPCWVTVWTPVVFFHPQPQLPRTPSPGCCDKATSLYPSRLEVGRTSLRGHSRATSPALNCAHLSVNTPLAKPSSVPFWRQHLTDRGLSAIKH